MDKKQQYSRPGCSKALSSDSRKGSDNYSSKPWTKNSRRRENPNCAATKNDNQRSIKFGPAKARPNVDKRPKARGSHPGCGSSYQSVDDVSSASTGLACDENSNVEISDNGSPDYFDAELNSVYATRSRKQNLNHLLNFNYGPRDLKNNGSNVFGKNVSNRLHVKKNKYNKEQFLQANFQFVVNWKAKSKISSSPDTLIDWDLIEQINIQTTEEPQCPICLYPPIAAKLTRCGHAYCWPCILHYLALTDKPWRKCPICYEAIHTSDLKSTTIVQQEHFCVGDYINLHLMQRKKGSLFVEKYKSIHSDKELPFYSTNGDIAKFAKFLVAQKSDVLSIIEREEQELLTCNREEHCPEFVFTQQALDLLNERKNEIDKHIALHMRTYNFKEKDVIGGNDETPLLKSAEELDRNSTYYFYQSVDGQNIFLHPLNVKMLKTCYDTLDQAPLFIRAKILQKEHHSMDEDHRRKFTCLGHLPLTCNFEVVEVQLESPTVTKDILNIFKDNILQRKHERLRREREEKRREIKINAINDRQMGKLISSTANINLCSSHEFPKCGFQESLPSQPKLNSDPIDVPIASTSKCNTYSEVANSLGSRQADSWSFLGDSSNPFNTAKSTEMKESPSICRRIASDRYSESDSISEFGEQFLQQTNLGVVLAEAINQKHNNINKFENTAGNKKNKKNKKMLLFSTGMNFNGK